jgi:hypothetical protein
MGLLFKNIKQLQSIKLNSHSTELQSKITKRKPENIKLTRKSKIILKQLGLQIRKNARK